MESLTSKVYSHLGEAYAAVSRNRVNCGYRSEAEPFAAGTV